MAVVSDFFGGAYSRRFTDRKVMGVRQSGVE
jgi:hypothetical protein